MKWLGVDTGGTFTDFVLLEESGHLRIHKVLSTPQAPELAIMQGIHEMGLDAEVVAGSLHIIHGSTIATNAALERKGVKTVYIANRGMRDVLTIGRQARQELYNLNPQPILPPVPEELCLEINCRMDSKGQVLEPLKSEELQHLQRQVMQLGPRAVAINLVFSFLNEEHEKNIAEMLSKKALAIDTELFISRSSEVLPEYKEYERGIATWLNAWLGPIVQAYLMRLEQEVAPCSVAMMQSSGGTIAFDQAASRAVHLLLSGPSGGLAAALHIGTTTGTSRLLTFDMGGTSTDVALLDGQIKLTNEGKIAGYPVAVPMVDMHTIGAGGGSIAWLDVGGMLQVGPQSAGAAPGPACYGKGGAEPTVTDANLVLGRIPHQVLLGGYLKLDVQAAREALKPLALKLGLGIEALAEGIVRIANEHMVRALKVISVFRGQDPKRFALCCFGGAGGLHLCELAESLGVTDAIVPAHGGVLSAFGMLVAPRQRTFTHTIVQRADGIRSTEVESLLEELRARALEELAKEHVNEAETQTDTTVACRYLGQSFTLDLEWQIGFTNPVSVEQAFHHAHQQRYGYQLQRPVELVTLKCRVYAETKAPEFASAESKQIPIFKVRVYGEEGKVSVSAREALEIGKVYMGPAIVVDKVSTLYIKSGWSFRRDSEDHLLLTNNSFTQL